MSDEAFGARPGRGSLGGDFRIGSVIGSSFALFRDHLLHFMALGTIMFIPPLAVTLLFSVPSLSPQVGTGQDFSTATGIASLLYLVLWFASAAAVTVSAFDVLRGQRPSFGQSVQRGLSRFLPLVGLTAVIVLLIIVITTVGGLVVAGLAAIGGVLGAVAAVIIGIGLLVLFFWLYLRWSLAIPAVVIERAGAFTSLRRSAVLTKGHRLKLLGIILLMTLMTIVVTLLVSVALAAGLGASGLPSGVIAAIAVGLNYLVQVSVAILFALMIAVAYYDLRRIKEGIGVSDIARVFD